MIRRALQLQNVSYFNIQCVLMLNSSQVIVKFCHEDGGVVPLDENDWEVLHYMMRILQVSYFSF